MKRQFTEEQIIPLLKQHESGITVALICREQNIRASTFYTWKAKYGGIEVSEAKRLRQLEDKNAKLKRLVADLSLDNVALKNVLAENGEARDEEGCRGLPPNPPWLVTTPRRVSRSERAQRVALPVQTS